MPVPVGITIRAETPADIPAIHELNRGAFLGHPHSTGTEPFIVDALRDDDALTVSLVAEQDGAVVGHVAFSAARVGGQAGWQLLGPVAVLPERQGTGIGSALVDAGLAVLRERGARGCVLVGDAGFYGRLGFSADPLVTYEGVPDEHVLCMRFDATGELPRGAIAAHPAFSMPRAE